MVCALLSQTHHYFRFVWAPEAAELARSICWPDCVKGDMNQALVSLGLVLHTLIVSFHCSIFSVLSLGCIVIFVLLMPAK